MTRPFSRGKRPPLRAGGGALVAALLLVAALAARGVAAPKGDPQAEAKARAKIAALWIEGGTQFKDKGWKAEAARAVAEAREVDPKTQGLDDLSKAVDALPEPAAADPHAAEVWKATAQYAAKEWEHLAALDHDVKENARFARYALKAVELDPSKARIAKALGTATAMSGDRAHPEAAGLLLARLRELDTEGGSKSKYDALEQEMALADVALVKAPGQGLVAWLSLPKGWTRKGETPVLVTVDGAGSNFLGSTRGFRDARGARKFIVLGPCTFSNTNDLKPETYPYYAPSLLEEWNGKRLDFDMPGLEAILSMLSERYGAAKKAAITGFSGGGNLCYSMVMRHPERIWAAAPACANFQPGLAGDEAVKDGGPPVHILTGEKDEHRNDVFGAKPGIEGQADWAQEAFTHLGFTHVKRTMLPGVPHSACVKEVWAFLDEVMAAK